MTLYVTTGAKKNVGDYLIHARGRALLNHFLPDVPLQTVPRWELGELGKDAAGLVLCGGPGVQRQMAEDTFPIAVRALEAGLPVFGLALGWSGHPATSPVSFTLSATSASMLRTITALSPLSVRDEVTKQILDALGIPAVLTGCSAWYSIPDLGQVARVPTSYSTIVFTTPANGAFTAEAVQVMEWMRKRFPNAQRIASFHRGIAPDKETSEQESQALMAQARAAESRGFTVLDAGYDLSAIGFYRDASLHVGYRVHAHLDFLSQRLPSVLICEDGRGAGQAVTLGDPDDVLWAGTPDLVAAVAGMVDREHEARWPSLDRAINMIEKSRPVMREAVEAVGTALR